MVPANQQLSQQNSLQFACPFRGFDNVKSGLLRMKILQVSPAIVW